MATQKTVYQNCSSFVSSNKIRKREKLNEDGSLLLFSHFSREKLIKDKSWRGGKKLKSMRKKDTTKIRERGEIKTENFNFKDFL